MYGGSSTRAGALGYDYYDAAAALPFPLPPLPELIISDEFDSLHEGTSYASSGCSSCYDSPSSAPSTHGDLTAATLMQRSISSHAVLNRINGHYYYSLCPYPASCEFVDSDAGPVRRVYSAGDLQRNGGAILMENGYKRSESPPLPLRRESSLIIEGMSRACRYSPEEKLERIERYRTKRHQRNFNKKIKYACRKTLADSRPRIRGRFARNDKVDQKKSTTLQFDDRWSLQMGREENEEEDDNWISFINAFSSGNSVIP